MRRLVVFGYLDPWQIQVVRCITRRYKWNVVYWQTGSREKRVIKDYFPDAIVHTSEESKELTKPGELQGMEWPLADAMVVRKLASHEPVLWPAFLRKAPSGRGVEGMGLKDEYHKILTFQYYLFEAIQPEIILFGNIPTGFYSFLFYVMACDAGVQTIVMRRAFVPERIAFPVLRIEEGSTRIRDQFQKLICSGNYKDVRLSPETDEYLIKLGGPYEDAMPDYFKSKFKIDKRTGKLRPDCSGVWEYAAVLGDEFGFQSPRRLFGKFRQIHRRQHLLKYYESHVTDLNLDKPYVLVNLHYQPEASTVPSGGIFGYQQLMVDLLSRSLPKDWMLYVKEQPSQLLRYNVNPWFRTTSYYENLLSYSNVRLVSVFEPNFHLVDKAKAVATVTGTAGWEAVNRGVPALCFGYAWYQYCEGVFHVAVDTEVSVAIEKIRNGYKVDGRKVRAFVKVLEEEGITGGFYSNDLEEKAGGAEKYGELKAKELCDRLDLLLF